ncbi:MAG: DUF1232 domain-containing protein [Candidatus Abyssobacteria bacterium SURF_5]|uniref:DUF1232 domain-containing protein n=1 Tax=Abyssobacteria bacterium (strain SURF_5) TaxID=2093360 RepID=A0A3A4NSA8_ABYX5|nr:MAG: DUF1232 domain-containing protein [Candidatus Abyssubacteria bacterium SURF_5]
MGGTMNKDKREAGVNILWLPTILALGILYVISKIDVMPDVIPFFGQLDDVIVALAIVWFFTTWLPKNRHKVYWSKKADERRRSSQPEDRQSTAAQEEPFNPFRILNVEKNASQEEIKRAYRKLMAKYHPDKVNHLGEEFQRLAHAKVVEIMKAYELLSGKE